MLKILVFGGNGYLGRQISEHYRAAVFTPEVDISDQNQINSVMNIIHPDVVINAAARTHGRKTQNARGCEEAPDLTYSANVLGANNVAEAARRVGGYLVHLSTGTIFRGDNSGRGFAETDQPLNQRELSLYYQTKIMGDDLVKFADVGSILRIQMPLGSQPHPRNLITKLASAETVYSIRNSIITVPSLLKALDGVIESRLKGIYHVVNPWPVRISDIARWYREIVDPHRPEYTVANAQEAAAVGYFECVLSTAKLAAAGIRLPPAEVAIKECLRGYKP